MRLDNFTTLGYAARALQGALKEECSKTGRSVPQLGLFSVVIISLSAMIGSGLFLLPSLAMLEMGGGESPAGGVWLAYLAASLVDSNRATRATIRGPSSPKL